MKKIPKWLSITLKVGVSLAAFGYVYYKLTQHRSVLDSEVSILELMTTVPEGSWPLLCLGFVLVIANLGLEARKWQVLMQEFYPDLSIWVAFRAVLSGMTTGIFTPNRLGEYAGRVLYLEEGHRLEATLLTFLDRISQMFITLVSGILALLVLIGRFEEDIESMLGGAGSSQLIVLGLGAFLLFIVGIVFNPRFLLLLLRRLDFKYSWVRKVESTLAHVKGPLLRKVLLLAFLRYLVFSTQYVLLLYGLGCAEAIFDAYGAVALIFLLKSLVPFVGLSELGVRESAAVGVLNGIFSTGSWIVVKASLALYVINIILPSVAGIGFLYGWKLSKKKEVDS